jgi:mono/diheme cytochrome c family protein
LRTIAVTLGIAVLLILGAGAAVLYSGIYDIGADAPHTGIVSSLIGAFRDRSVTAHAKGIVPPRDLNSAQRISAGAGLYNEMCTGCHLGPGLEKSELSQGLYPHAPELANGTDLTPAQQFWVIKHGVKLTAMPAWGKTHDDELIWDMVAFLQRLPKLSAAQYNTVVASAPADHDEMMKAMNKRDQHR